MHKIHSIGYCFYAEYVHEKSKVSKKIECLNHIGEDL
jgi:hypothetical protein